MSGILRDCFIRLHSQDLLGDLRRDFAGRYADFVVKQGVVTKYAQSLRTSNHSEGEDGRSGHHLTELAKDMGPSALPPLAVAAERKLMADALQEANEARTEEEEDALEEKSFLADEEAEDSPEADMEAEPEDGKKKRKSKKAKETKTKRAGRSKGASGRGKYLSLPDLLPEVPPKGTFDLERIRTSPYFFS